MNCEFYHKGKDNACINQINNGSTDDPAFCSRPIQFFCIEDLKKHLPRMSHSSRMDFCRCRRLYYYRKILGLQVKKIMLSNPIKMGLIWDRFISSIYNDEKFKNQFWVLVDEYDLTDEDVAKLFALLKAFRAIGIAIDRDGFIGCQHEFEYIDDSVCVRGFIDRASDDHIVETKLTARPDFYFNLHAITSQMSTYFLSDDRYEYCIVEAVQVPQLKTSWGKYSDEDGSNYMERIYQDIISRPSHYFPGFDREKKTFGKRFWRSEFPLDQIRKDYNLITKDIRRAIEESAFYQNFLACHVPTQCAYLSICKTGVISERIYEQKSKTNGGDESENHKQ